jgi:hypothetical protein
MKVATNAVRLSANRTIKNGIEADRRKQQEFFDLAERFRAAKILKRLNALAINWAEWCSAASHLSQ